MSKEATPVLPELNALNKPFWQGGFEGDLNILRCEDCEHYIHPPVPVCSNCLSRKLQYQKVSGQGKIYSYTICYHAFSAAFEAPYVVVLVELKEQENLRLTTYLEGCPPDAVNIDLPVEVVFREYDDVALPHFRPAT